MQVRAKFYVLSVTHHLGGDRAVVMSPVTTGSEENKSFSKYTPSGKLEMFINKGTAAADQFEPGQEYYIDFTIVPKEVPTLN